MKKEVISFRKLIKANTKETLTERVKGSGKVESLRVRFYSGQENDLHVTPYILYKGNRMRHLITYPNGTDGFLSGEDDNFSFDISINVANDDELHVIAENVSAYDYDVVVDIGVEYTMWGDQ